MRLDANLLKDVAQSMSQFDEAFHSLHSACRPKSVECAGERSGFRVLSDSRRADR